MRQHTVNRPAGYRPPAFAILDAPKANVAIVGPAPSAAGSELAVVPERPSTASIVERLEKVGAVVGRYGRCREWGERIAIVNLALSVGASYAIGTCTGSPLAAIGFMGASFFGPYLGLWWKQKSDARGDLAEIAKPLTSNVGQASSPLERVMLQEAAVRFHGEAESLEPELLASMTRADTRIDSELRWRVRCVYYSLFEGHTLRPLPHVLDNVERLIWALETSSAPERPILADFIERHVRHLLTERRSRGAEDIRVAMLRESLAGRRYRFSDLPAESEAMSSAFEHTVGEIALTLKQATVSHPKACAWGRGYCDDINTATRVAAHYERKGYRVSVGQHDEPGKPKISVIAYADQLDPGPHIHRRLPVDWVWNGQYRADPFTRRDGKKW